MQKNNIYFMNVKISRELHKKLKTISIETETHIYNLVEQAILQFIDK